MISVLVIDDHAVVRSGLRDLLDSASDISVAATAADGAEALDLVREHNPDVVLMDISMPGVGGIEATRRICSDGQSAHVVILTSFSDRERILDALDAGALGYLLKDAEPEEILRGVRAASRGEAPLAPKAALALIKDRVGAPEAKALTERERDVLTLVGQGLSNKVIAQRLSISEKTVKAHLTRVFRSIGVTDRTQAALWAQRHDV